MSKEKIYIYYYYCCYYYCCCYYYYYYYYHYYYYYYYYYCCYFSYHYCHHSYYHSIFFYCFHHRQIPSGNDWVPLPATLSRPNSLRIIQPESQKFNNFRKDEVVSKHVVFTDLKSKNPSSNSAANSSLPLKISQAQRLKELIETSNEGERTDLSSAHPRKIILHIPINT